MTWELPWAWLWLLALIPVVLLYFLRRRERDFPVSALFLWEGVRPDQPHFLQRLRHRFDLLLFLQALAVVLFAFALSRPAFFALKPSGATLLVLDASASTASEAVAEKIRAEAKRLVRESSGPWAAVLWTDPPATLAGPTSSQAEILRALDLYRPTLRRRPPLARALALFPEPWPRVVVITDNPAGVIGAEVIQVERPPNLALTAFSVRPTPDGTRYEAFLRVLNATPKYQDVQVRVRTEAGEFWASRLLPPGGEEDLVLPLFGARAGAFVAELLPGDPFPWDNVRYFAFSTGTVRVAFWAKRTGTSGRPCARPLPLYGPRVPWTSMWPYPRSLRRNRRDRRFWWPPEARAVPAWVSVPLAPSGPSLLPSSPTFPWKNSGSLRFTPFAFPRGPRCSLGRENCPSSSFGKAPMAAGPSSPPSLGAPTSPSFRTSPCLCETFWAGFFPRSPLPSSRSGKPCGFLRATLCFPRPGLWKGFGRRRNLASTSSAGRMGRGMWR